MWQEKTWRALGLALVCVGGGAVRAGDSSASLSFSDQTAAAGVLVTHGGSGGTDTSGLSGGGAVGDFNGDGWQDLYLALHLQPDRLFINNGDGTFSDQSAAAGIVGGSVAAAAGDFDRDGDVDIFATGPNSLAKLYRNDGDGTFTNVALAAGVVTTGGTNSPSFGAAFGDYDADGHLDLFVAARELGFGELREPNTLYRNNGDGTFTNIAATIGLFADATTPLFDLIAGYSPRFVDMDGDRAPELLLVNDFGTTLYFSNDGDGTFTNRTANIPELQTFPAELMGQAVADFNDDGLLDWYISNTPPSKNPGTTGNQLFLNLGNHFYDEVSIPAGVNQGQWGWGVVAVDLNHDGWVDIAETNGWANGHTNDPSFIYLHNGLTRGMPTFTDVAAQTGFHHTGMGRGLINFDHDNDGDQDLLIITNGGPTQLYRNDLSGPGANWLRVFLDTAGETALPPNGFGSIVRVTAQGRTQMRSVDGGCHFLTTNELSAHFGLGGAMVVDELRVEWPDGRDTVLTNVAANQTITVSPDDGPAPIPADLNGSDTVNAADLAILLGAWSIPAGTPGCGGKSPCAADLTGDGLVNAADLAILLGAWTLP